MEEFKYKDLNGYNEAMNEMDDKVSYIAKINPMNDRFYREHIKSRLESEAVKKQIEKEATIGATILAVMLSTIPVFFVIMLIKFLFE